MGARWIDVPYVQPELSEGGGRCRHLLLIAFPEDPSVRLVSGKLVGAFLREFYLSLNVSDPENDSDFQAMQHGLFERMPLLNLELKITDETPG
jgi:hypothetical protein